MEKNRHGSAYFVNNFVHVRLPTFEPIRAALTSQDLSFDTKFSPSQSRVTLPLKDLVTGINAHGKLVSEPTTISN